MALQKGLCLFCILVNTTDCTLIYFLLDLVQTSSFGLIQNVMYDRRNVRLSKSLLHLHNSVISLAAVQLAALPVIKTLIQALLVRLLNRSHFHSAFRSQTPISFRTLYLKIDYSAMNLMCSTLIFLRQTHIVCALKKYL